MQYQTSRSLQMVPNFSGTFRVNEQAITRLHSADYKRKVVMDTGSMRRLVEGTLPDTATVVFDSVREHVPMGGTASADELVLKTNANQVRRDASETWLIKIRKHLPESIEGFIENGTRVLELLHAGRLSFSNNEVSLMQSVLDGLQPVIDTLPRNVSITPVKEVFTKNTGELRTGIRLEAKVVYSNFEGTQRRNQLRQFDGESASNFVDRVRETTEAINEDADNGLLD